MRQFGKIFNFELKYYLKNKGFIGFTLFLVLLIAAVMFFPRISEVFSSKGTTEENKASANVAIMLVKAETQEQTEMIQKAFKEAFTGYDVQGTLENTDAIKEKVTSGDAKCAFVMSDSTSYTYYVSNLSINDMNTNIANETLQNMYKINAMVNSGMTIEQAEDVMNIQINSEVESIGKNQIQNFFYTYIMIFALYMVIILYGQRVATSVATEKSSRAMELLITSANPTSMIFGKVLASCFAGLIQLVAVFGSALIFYDLNESYWSNNNMIGSLFNIPPELFAYMLVFFVLGFLIYSFLFGAMGSTVTKLEEIGKVTLPLTYIFIIAFLIVINSITSGGIDSSLMKICSYIPFTSPMAMFTRVAMSNVALSEIAISIAILIASVFGVGVISAKIYRVGVLLYGTTPKIGAILKAVWKA